MSRGINNQVYICLFILLHDEKRSIIYTSKEQNNKLTPPPSIF